VYERASCLYHLCVCQQTPCVSCVCQQTHDTTHHALRPLRHTPSHTTPCALCATHLLWQRETRHKTQLQDRRTRESGEDTDATPATPSLAQATPATPWSAEETKSFPLPGPAGPFWRVSYTGVSYTSLLSTLNVTAGGIGCTSAKVHEFTCIQNHLYTSSLVYKFTFIQENIHTGALV